MLVNDDGMLVNDGEMSIWSFTHLTNINEHFSSISLKYTIIRLSDHHWEAAPTVVAQQISSEDMTGIEGWILDMPSGLLNTLIPVYFM